MFGIRKRAWRAGVSRGPCRFHPPIVQLNAHTLWAFTLVSQLSAINFRGKINAVVATRATAFFWYNTAP